MDGETSLVELSPHDGGEGRGGRAGTHVNTLQLVKLGVVQQTAVRVRCEPVNK